MWHVGSSVFERRVVKEQLVEDTLSYSGNGFFILFRNTFETCTGTYCLQHHICINVHVTCLLNYGQSDAGVTFEQDQL